MTFEKSIEAVGDHRGNGDLSADAPTNACTSAADLTLELVQGVASLHIPTTGLGLHPLTCVEVWSVNDRADLHRSPHGPSNALLFAGPLELQCLPAQPRKSYLPGSQGTDRSLSSHRARRHEIRAGRSPLPGSLSTVLLGISYILMLNQRRNTSLLNSPGSKT